MDAVYEAMAKYGDTFEGDAPGVLTRVFDAVQAEQNKKYGSDIKVDKALKYGPDARNRIDVYSPASGASGRPVVVYFHGGGLVFGDNDATPNIYSNIGNYFTANGCITCLATYRLALQTAHHPNGAEDVRGTLEWIQANISKYGGDPTKVVAMGQSAGGYHLLTAMMLGYLDAPGLLRGAVSLSAPFTMSDTDPERTSVTMDYHQTKKLWEVKSRWSPLALFRQRFFGTAEKPGHEAFPCELLLLVGDLELEEIMDGTWKFVDAHKERFGKLPVLEVMRGHNHVSYCFGLGLDAPDFERAGKRILGFVNDFTK